MKALESPVGTKCSKSICATCSCNIQSQCPAATSQAALPTSNQKIRTRTTKNPSANQQPGDGTITGPSLPTD